MHDDDALKSRTITHVCGHPGQRLCRASEVEEQQSRPCHACIQQALRECAEQTRPTYDLTPGVLQYAPASEMDFDQLIDAAHVLLLEREQIASGWQQELHRYHYRNSQGDDRWVYVATSRPDVDLYMTEYIVVASPLQSTTPDDELAAWQSLRGLVQAQHAAWEGTVVAAAWARWGLPVPEIARRR